MEDFDAQPELADCAYCRQHNCSRCIDKHDPDTRVCGCILCH